MPANDTQVGGSHYKTADGLQHWDICLQFRVPYTIGCATKYLFRWRDKNGIQDLEKALHYAQKSLENLEILGGMERPVPLDAIPSTVGVEEREISRLLFNFEFSKIIFAKPDSNVTPEFVLKWAINKLALFIELQKKKFEDTAAHPGLEDQPTAGQLHP
jgi:hypothetical protein